MPHPQIDWFDTKSTSLNCFSSIWSSWEEFINVIIEFLHLSLCKTIIAGKLSVNTNKVDWKMPSTCKRQLFCHKKYIKSPIIVIAYNVLWLRSSSKPILMVAHLTLQNHYTRRPIYKEHLYYEQTSSQIIYGTTDWHRANDSFYCELKFEKKKQSNK